MTFDVGRHTTLIVNILFKTSIFQRTGKKNDCSLISDADREIPTLGSTDNVGNLINLVTCIILGAVIFLSASKTNDRFYSTTCMLNMYCIFRKIV